MLYCTASLSYCLKWYHSLALLDNCLLALIPRNSAINITVVSVLINQPLWAGILLVG